MRLIHHPIALCGLLLAATLLAAGCGNKDAKPASTQVAAKVGSEEISVHQINKVIARMNVASMNPESIQAVRRTVLDRLIDQQLAIDQAIGAKLDRSPEVVAQLETARREVLARAYIEQVTSALPKPTDEEVRKYYTEHPQLFVQRRLYSLQEVVIPTTGNAELPAQLRAQLAAGKTPEDVATWLRGRDIKFSASGGNRAAEQIPLELLARLHTLKDGQTTLIEQPRSLTVVRIAASQAAPVSEEAAKPRIQLFLANQRGAEAVASSIKQLRAKTEISYVGDFAQAAKPDAATAAPVQPLTVADPTTALPPAAAPTPAPAAAAAGPNDADARMKAAMEKGISGLK